MLDSNMDNTSMDALLGHNQGSRKKERGKSPVLSQSFRFEDLRCDRRIRDIYILFIYCIYINNIYIYIYI